jgi:hypothetical protein
MKVSEGKSIHIDQYPNFSATGSIKGMIEKYYGKDAMLVRCGSYIYNVPSEVYYRAY